jgi:hypothetical protein
MMAMEWFLQVESDEGEALAGDAAAEALAPWAAETGARLRPGGDGFVVRIADRDLWPMLLGLRRRCDAAGVRVSGKRR